MPKWIKITDEYTSKIKPYARRKIRLQKGNKPREVWTRWDAYEKCFFWDQGESAVYMDDPHQRPTHVMMGS